MTQSSKRGLFASVFGSKKKTEEELEADHESRLRLENRIREVLAVIEPPRLEPALESTSDVDNLAEVQPVALVPSSAIEPAKEPEYTYLYLTTAPEAQRKSPLSSPYHAALQSLAPARASQAR